MSISTEQKLNTASPSSINQLDQRHLAFTQVSVNNKAEYMETVDCYTIKVFASDAEAQVIASKARKSGLNVNEYMRQAALGFPIVLDQ